MADPTGQGFGPGGLSLGAAVPIAQPVDASGSPAAPVKASDGAMVTEGNTADAAVTGDNPGTISAKLRGLAKLFFSVWDSVNNYIFVALKTVISNSGVGNTATPWATHMIGTGPSKSLAATLVDTAGNTIQWLGQGEGDAIGGIALQSFSKMLVLDPGQGPNAWLRVRTPQGAHGQDSTTAPGRGQLAMGIMGSDYGTPNTISYRAKIDSLGNLYTVAGIPALAGSALSSVAASTLSVTVLAANTARKAVVIVNDGSGTVYLTFGATSSTTSFTMKLGPQATYESGAWVYTGVISGIWDIANGSARVTELT
jgi:hypothetical protein